jgi:hypothetical protein
MLIGVVDIHLLLSNGVMLNHHDQHYTITKEKVDINHPDQYYTITKEKVDTNGVMLIGWLISTYSLVIV